MKNIKKIIPITFFTITLLFIAISCENQDDDPQFVLTEASETIELSNDLLYDPVPDGVSKI